MPLAPNSSLLHYKLLSQIGEGGMGVVWKAVDTTLDREVAVKILPEQFATDAERLARFEREAKLLASLNHPNIAAVYGLHETQGVRFLVMELVDGDDLSERLKLGALPADDALEAAGQIAAALEAAHEAGVIHRDLKPANIVINNEGQVKVLDFGLAKALDPTAGETSGDPSLSPTMTSAGTVAGMILGTAAYMSPEQARGKSVDSRTDIWAFGCVLYELLTGRQMFRGETITDVLGAILHREPDWNALPGGLPASIHRLLRRCLERDQRKRRRDIGDARIVLEEALAGKWETETEPPAAAAAPAPKSRLPVLIGTAVGAAFLGAAAVWMWATPGDIAAPLRKFDIPMVSTSESGALFFDPVISPDGKRLAYAKDNQLWVRDLDKIAPIALAGTEDAGKPLWSPDSQWLAFTRDRRIEKVPITGGQPTLVAVTTSQTDLSNGSGVWREDGHIVWTSGEAGILQVSAQGGDVTSLLDPAEGESDFHEICLLPGGGLVFVVHDSGGDFGRLGLMTPDGERRDVIDLDPDNLYSPAYSPSGHLLFRRTGAAAGVWAVPFSIKGYEVTGEPFLVAPGGRIPSVASDGTLAYLHRGAIRHSRLLWVDRDGGNRQPIGDPLQNLTPFPDLSADNSQVLIVGSTGENRQVWMYDTVSGLRRQLTFSKENHQMAMWGSVEDQVLYYSNNPLQLRMTSPDGSRPEQVLDLGIMPDMTADGSRLVLARQKPDSWDWDIVARDWDGEPDQFEILIEAEGVQWYPKLSPDGSLMLYTSDESGQDEIFVTPYPDTRRGRQISREGGSFAQWRGDGREVYFARDNAIIAVEVNAAGAPTGEPRELFRRPVTNWSENWIDGFDVTPDGQRFVVAENVGNEDEQPAIVVVQNWFKEFE